MEPYERRARGLISWNDPDVPEWANVILEHKDVGSRVFAEGRFVGAKAWPFLDYSDPGHFDLLPRHWRVVSQRPKRVGPMRAKFRRNEASDTANWNDPMDQHPLMLCETSDGSQGYFAGGAHDNVFVVLKGGSRLYEGSGYTANNLSERGITIRALPAGAEFSIVQE